eukprot:scaffold46950_cov32-Prasinocladus_malaysianus.AAC.1
MTELNGTHDIDEGTYALLGAASFLGGAMRMTVSLCVILLELTNNLNLLPLIMLVLLVAKVRPAPLQGLSRVSTFSRNPADVIHHTVEQASWSALALRMSPLWVVRLTAKKNQGPRQTPTLLKLVVCD